MFLNLFRLTAVGSTPKPLEELCNNAFARHGGPPQGAAKSLSESIRKIHEVNNFADFLVWMGMKRPDPADFTTFLRKCCIASVEKGYSRMPISKDQALALRRVKEPSVEVMVGEGIKRVQLPNMTNVSFFPEK